MHIPRCCIVAGLAIARVAVADPNPEAEALFRDGRAALKAGHVAEACDKFTASSHVDPTVGTLLNVGDCRARLGQTATAWAAFVEAARVAKRTGDARRAEAVRRASELEPKLSYLTIAATPVAGETVTRSGSAVDAALFGEGVPLDPGTYEIAASAPGHRGWSRTVVVRAGGEHQRVEVPALVAVRIPTPEVAAAAVAAPRTPSTFTVQRDVAVGVAVAGLAAIGTSTVLALQARSLEREARAVCPAGQPCGDLAAAKKSDDAVAKANLATYVGIGGIAALGAGTVLWLTGAPGPHITPTVTRESVGVSWGGHF